MWSGLTVGTSSHKMLSALHLSIFGIILDLSNHGSSSAILILVLYLSFRELDLNLLSAPIQIRSSRPGRMEVVKSIPLAGPLPSYPCCTAPFPLLKCLP